MALVTCAKSAAMMPTTLSTSVTGRPSSGAGRPSRAARAGTTSDCSVDRRQRTHDVDRGPQDEPPQRIGEHLKRSPARDAAPYNTDPPSAAATMANSAASRVRPTRGGPVTTTVARRPPATARQWSTSRSSSIARPTSVGSSEQSTAGGSGTTPGLGAAGSHGTSEQAMAMGKPFNVSLPTGVGLCPLSVTPAIA